MRSFGNWLLLEREFDRVMRDAAGQTFDRMQKSMMQIVRKGIDHYISSIEQFGKPTPYNQDDTGRIRREISNFISDIMKIGVFQSGKKVNLDANLFNNTVTLRYRMKDKGEMFFPPNVKFKDFQKHLVGSIGLMDIVIRAPYGGEEFGGTYKTGRKDASFEININNFASLYADENSLLHKVFTDVMRLRIEEKSSKAIMQQLNKWLAAFEKELGEKRDLFVHEYIHFLDDMRYKSTSDRPGNIAAGIKAAYDGVDPLKRKYYTSDAEMNSYFQGAAAEIEDAIKMCLISATTNMAATSAIGRSTLTHSKFDALTVQAKCTMVADAVIAQLYRRVDEELREPWVAQHIEKMLDIPPSQTGLKGLPLFCLALVTWQSFSTSLFSFEDPKTRKKLLTRIVMFAQDIEKVIAEYRTRMSQGKVPSSQEFNKAREKFKPGGYATKSKAAYNIFYMGFMIDKKVYDPKKPYQPD